MTACSSFALTDALDRFGQGCPPGTVIYNGVEEETASTAATPSRGRYVLGVGRLVGKKGFDLLIEAAARLPSNLAEIEIVLAGDGPECEPLRRLSERLGIAHKVRLLGRATRAEVSSLLANAEAVVVPSLVEPFGLVVLEAWQAGKPVISTKFGGVSEYAEDGVDAILVDPTDTAELARALEVVLTRPEVRSSLGLRGAEKARLLSWADASRSYARIYRSCLDSSYGPLHRTTSVAAD